MVKVSFKYGVLLFFIIMMTGCVSSYHSYSPDSSETADARKAVVSYISQMVGEVDKYRENSCDDPRMWWCMARDFSGEYDIEFGRSDYDVIFFTVDFREGASYLFPVSFRGDAWTILEEPVKAGRSSLLISYLGEKSGRMMILGLEYGENGDISVQEIRGKK